MSVSESDLYFLQPTGRPLFFFTTSTLGGVPNSLSFWVSTFLLSSFFLGVSGSKLFLGFLKALSDGVDEVEAGAEVVTGAGTGSGAGTGLSLGGDLSGVSGAAGTPWCVISTVLDSPGATGFLVGVDCFLLELGGEAKAVGVWSSSAREVSKSYSDSVIFSSSCMISSDTSLSSATSFSSDLLLSTFCLGLST